MIVELIIASLIGIIVGAFTGLSPAIHINLVAALLLANIDKFSFTSPLALALFIATLSIAHTFIDFIPSILLGAPEEDTALSVLPGHKLLQQGRGFEAVVLTQYGALMGIILSLVLTPIFILFLPSAYQAIKIAIPFILIFISAYIILRDKSPLTALLIFSAAGILGLLTFNSPIEIKEPLLPLLTGLFGLSSLLTSIKSNPKLPAQKIRPLAIIKPTKKEFLSTIKSAILASPFGSILPGVGSGHAAVLGSELHKSTPRTFLLMLGIINTSVMALSIVTAYSIAKTRTGSAVAIQQLLNKIELSHLIIILLAILLSSILIFIISINLSKLFIRTINKINYKILNLSVLGIVILINILITNWVGIIVLILATILGLTAVNSTTRRINLMACLILPSIVYYLIH
jgi:putative membrane protein